MKTIKDALMESRLDSRDIATCAKYLVEHGATINSNSELLWLITQLAVYAIGHNEFETTQDARDYLSTLGITKLNRSGKNKETLHKALQKDTLKADGFDPNYVVRKSKHMIPDQTWEDMVQKAIKQAGTKEPIDHVEALKNTIAQSKRVLLGGGDE